MFVKTADTESLKYCIISAVLDFLLHEVLIYVDYFTGASHLSSPLAKVPKGLIHLNLSHCGLSSKGVNQVAHALSLNKFMPSTLTYLNLSDNNLKEEINVSSFANISIIFYKIKNCVFENQNLLLSWLQICGNDKCEKQVEVSMRDGFKVRFIRTLTQHLLP